MVCEAFGPIITKIYLKIRFQLSQVMIGSCVRLVLISQPVLRLDVGEASECHWCIVAG